MPFIAAEDEPPIFKWQQLVTEQGLDIEKEPHVGQLGNLDIFLSMGFDEGEDFSVHILF